MTQIAITTVFALSYNMLLGQTGMLSFGHAVFMGLGGFGCIHLMNHAYAADIPLPLPLLPVFAGLFSMAIAAVIGALSVRRSGAIFAMISLGIVELVAAFAVITSVFFQGGGAGFDRTLAPPIFGVDFGRRVEVYYLVVLWTLAAAALMAFFTRTPAGRMAVAVRENAERAAFVGYSPALVRFLSFLGAGFFAGVAGGLFAITYELVTVENLTFQASGAILMIAFLGGVGHFAGPILGAVVFTLLQSVLSLETYLWRLYLGALFLGCVMYFPTGLAGVIAAHGPAARAGRLRPLIWPYLGVFVPAAISVLGLAALAELFLAQRTAAVGEHEVAIYWLIWDWTGPAPWALAAAAALGGFVAARRAAPAAHAAWIAVTPR